MHKEHFINIQKPENEEKKTTASLKPEILSPADQLDAITWAANQAGQSYGQFSARLTTEEKEHLYVAYTAWQKERIAEIRERMKKGKNDKS